MKIFTLVENSTSGDFLAEHGLSLYIEYEGKKILLDAGKSESFLKNADKLYVGLEAVDFAVLSHAHYDHGDGLPYFMERNDKANLYINKNAKENCYGGEDKHYIGLKQGFLEKYQARIVYASGVYKIAEGIYLVSHNTHGLEKIGEENKLYRLENGNMIPDDFNHEQSLVFWTNNGLVIFNSCSHGHVDNIIEDVKTAFPGKKIFAFVGGFHLSKRSENFVREYARAIRKYDLEKIYTGHCTGERAFEILKQELGETVENLWSGKVLEL